MNNYEVYILETIYDNEIDNCLDLDLIAEILASGMFQLI